MTTKFIFKPQAPFETIYKTAENPGIGFMRSIILQAILDYTATKNPNSNLFNWFFIQNKNFQYICNNAKLDIYDVRQNIIQIIKHTNKKKYDYLCKITTDQISKDLK